MSVEVEQLVSVWKHREHKWEIGSEDYANALTSLMDILPTENKESFVTWLHGKVVNELNLVIETFGDYELKTDTFPQIISLSKLLECHGSPLQAARYPSLNEKKWGQWAEQLVARKLSIAIVLPEESVISALINKVDLNQLDNNTILVTLIYTVKIYGESIHWKKLISKLGAWIVSADNNIAFNDVYELLIFSLSNC